MIVSDSKAEILEYIKNFKSRELVTLQCINCGNKFSKPKQKIQLAFNTKKQDRIYCSAKCHSEYSTIKTTKPCSHCGLPVSRTPSAVKKNKSDNVFCNSSCSASYANTHKTVGTRRSKLEVWLETKLPQQYPDLNFLFNDKVTINSELDIYIPKFKLAFELNGIFHYEPIFGNDKLSQIQNNDINKFQKCQQNNISLCIIDTSWIKYNKESNFQKILDIIISIISTHKV